MKFSFVAASMIFIMTGVFQNSVLFSMEEESLQLQSPRAVRKPVVESPSLRTGALLRQSPKVNRMKDEARKKKNESNAGPAVCKQDKTEEKQKIDRNKPTFSQAINQVKKKKKQRDLTQSAEYKAFQSLNSEIAMIPNFDKFLSGLDDDLSGDELLKKIEEYQSKASE